MPDLSKGIATIDGEKESVAAKEWMSNLNQMIRLYRWPASFTLETARAHLKGAALNWVSKKASELKDWNQCEAAFPRTFISMESLTSK